MRSILIFIIQLGWIGLTLQQQQQQPLTENQNYLNYQQQNQQGRYLSSFPQNTRSGYFQLQQQQQQDAAAANAGSYQHSADFFLDGPSTPYNPFQSFAAPISDDYGDRHQQQQPFIPVVSPPQTIPARSRHHASGSAKSASSSSSSSAERFSLTDSPGASNINLQQRQPQPSQKTNRERLRENLKGRITTTTPETIVTTRRAASGRASAAAQAAAKKTQQNTKYTPVTRTTSKRPQEKDQQQQSTSTQQQRQNSKSESSETADDQKFSLSSRNSRVKGNSQDSFETPSHQYQISISHSDDEYDRNNFRVKTLESLKKGQSREVDEEEYEDYEDEDYGVILTEEERAIRESSTTQQPATTRAPSTTPTTTQKPEENTVIIFDNFILPGQDKKQDEQDQNNDEEGVEYEYEYIDEEEDKAASVTTAKPPTTKSLEKPSTKADDFEITTYRDAKKILGQAVVQVVTTKSVVNAAAAETETPEPAVVETTTEEENYPSTRSPLTPRTTTTEDYYVIASVQTSRSVSGAHFLPFDNVEQEEKKKSKTELKTVVKNGADGKYTTLVPDNENVSSEIQDDEFSSSDEVTRSPPTTVKYQFNPQPSTESIIDKLDKIQSELSLGVLSGEYPVLKDTSAKKVKIASSTTSTTTESPPESAADDDETTAKPFIRKFSPKSTIPTTQRTTTTQKVIIKHTPLPSSTAEPSTTSSTTTVPSTTEKQRNDKKIIFNTDDDDDLAGLLPPGFKPRDSYKNKKITTTTTTTSLPLVKDENVKSKNSSTAGRSYKPGISAQALPTSGFKGFKNKGKTTKTSEDNETENVPKKLLSKLFESSDDSVDLSKFLPPDFKSENKSEHKLTVIPLADGDEDLAGLLPRDYRPAKTTTAKPKIKLVEQDDISKFLPADFKPAPEEKDEGTKNVLSSLLDKIKFSAPKDLLPDDFKESVSETPIYIPTTEEPKKPQPSNNGKVVFPSRFGNKPARLTTARPHVASGPPPPDPGIRRGPPTRATTEFTGWPSKATTPISIEKLLELQGGAVTINFEDLLARSTATQSTTQRTTTTTTTTTTTVRPTQPSVCRTECSLAATIRIVDGVEWSPELLTIHTAEYKKLASDLEAELNSVYSNAPQLQNWFKKVKIDSFSKGSVLVDYFVELAEVPKEINTQEIKSLFHLALTPAYMRDEEESGESNNNGEGSAQKIVKDAFKLGNYVVDPVSTDFIVIQKVATQRPDIEEDNLLPQWAVAMITVGCLSLVFVILFGVAVLVNKKKASKKKPPTPLTADMLNELNKNHMGGLENYGAEDLYNLDDTWDERRQEAKPKVKRFSTTKYDNNPNIYDSWRSQHLERYQPDYDYYDSHDPFNDLQQPKYHQNHHQSSNHQPPQQTSYGGGSSSKRYAMEAQWNSPYQFNSSSHNYSSSRRLRDYDQHF